MKTQLESLLKLRDELSKLITDTEKAKEFDAGKLAPHAAALKPIAEAIRKELKDTKCAMKAHLQDAQSRANRALLQLSEGKDRPALMDARDRLSVACSALRRHCALPPEVLNPPPAAPEATAKAEKAKPEPKSEAKPAQN
jgi:hypothetical protein